MFHLRGFHFRRIGQRLRLVAAGLGLLSQAAVVMATVVEGSQGLGAAAHVEQSGTRTHYTHDDATCAACQARSIHSAAPLAFGARLTAHALAATPIIGAQRLPSTELSPDYNPRAPPTI